MSSFRESLNSENPTIARIRTALSKANDLNNGFPDKYSNDLINSQQDIEYVRAHPNPVYGYKDEQLNSDKIDGLAFRRDDIDDIIGFKDVASEWEGIPEQELDHEITSPYFKRIFGSVWFARCRALCMIRITGPQNSKVSILISNRIVFEGKLKNLRFHPNGVPCPTGFFEMTIDNGTSAKPPHITITRQQNRRNCLAANRVKAGGYHATIFDTRYYVHDNQALEALGAIGTVTRNEVKKKKRMSRNSILMTTGNFCSDLIDKVKSK